MDKEKLYIFGAIASIVALYLIFKKRDAIVQAPSIGRVVTQPSGSTDVQLGFQSTLAQLAAGIEGKRIDASNQQELARIAGQNQAAQLAAAGSLQASQLATSLDLARIQQGGETDRARIYAESAANQNGASYAAELARLQAQQSTQERALSAQNRRDLLSAIGQGLSSLSSLLRRQQGGQGGGTAGGQGSQGTAARRSNPYYNVPTPRGVTGINPFFQPDFPYFGGDTFDLFDYSGINDYQPPFGLSNQEPFGFVTSDFEYLDFFPNGVPQFDRSLPVYNPSFDEWYDYEGWMYDYWE